MRFERARSSTQTEPLQRGSSQSLARVQPKNPFRLYSRVGLFFFCLLLACSDDPYGALNGQWVVDIPLMQEALTDATHAKPQAKAAAQLSRALLERYHFKFEPGQLAYGQRNKMRVMQLEYLRTEKKTRLVFRTSDSPFLLRVTPKEGNLLIDFEDKIWHLKRSG